MAKRSARRTGTSRNFHIPAEACCCWGQDAALARAARAIRSGKPPQAWLISGPPGVGKATMAYRIARYLLAHGAKDGGAADLSVPANDPAALQVAAGAHPGLLLLKRGINPKTGKLMTVLGVDEIRKLAGFFGMTSGAGGWRVAIVDTADDMNDNAANALLKMLEEPPGRAMLLLLVQYAGPLASHHPLALPAAGAAAAGRSAMLTGRWRHFLPEIERGRTRPAGAPVRRLDRRGAGAGGRRGPRTGRRSRPADRACTQRPIWWRCWRWATGFTASMTGWKNSAVF